MEKWNYVNYNSEARISFDNYNHAFINLDNNMATAMVLQTDVVIMYLDTENHWHKVGSPNEYACLLRDKRRFLLPIGQMNVANSRLARYGDSILFKVSRLDAQTMWYEYISDIYSTYQDDNSIHNIYKLDDDSIVDAFDEFEDGFHYYMYVANIFDFPNEMRENYRISLAKTTILEELDAFSPHLESTSSLGMVKGNLREVTQLNCGTVYCTEEDLLNNFRCDSNKITYYIEYDNGIDWFQLIRTDENHD